jgi:site-specific recombinase XerD
MGVMKMKNEKYEKLTGKGKKLMDQVQKIFKSDNQKSYKTKYRYLAGEERFCQWLSENYNIQKIKNVKARHFIAYKDFLQGQQRSEKYIKTELSSVRHFHELTESKERLPENSKLDLKKCNFGGVSRSWTDDEVKKSLELAHQMGRTDVEKAIMISYAFGTRLEECTTLNAKQIKDAIKNRQLELTNTKGARPRGIDMDLYEKLRNFQIKALNFAFEHKASDEKIFIKPGQKTHEVIKSIQDWIYNHRNKFQNQGRIDRNDARKAIVTARENHSIIETPKSNLTMHGLRHTFAQKIYTELVNKKIEREKERTRGKELSKEKIHKIEKEARKEVSHELGHGRDDITRVYIK